MGIKMTTEEFIRRSELKHGKGRYDYGQVEYKKSKDEVEIGCLRHGYFFQRANSHLSGRGCRVCKGERISETKRKTLEDFISRARHVHGDRYDYCRSRYSGSKSRLLVVCETHGPFGQTPSDHLSGKGCVQCKNDATGKRLRKSFGWFVDRAREIHGNRFTYSADDYSTTRQKVKITCQKHGLFCARVNDHLNGSGCPACNESRGERAVARVLEGLGVRHERGKRFRDCRDKNMLPFDFWLPDHNNLLIEFDGRQHFEDIYVKGRLRSRVLEVQRRDRIKDEWASENGYRLIRIHYDEVDDLELIVMVEVFRSAVAA